MDGQSFTFPGSMGLAPDWQTRGLSEAEQELVTACILSRTNAFGVSLEISLRESRPESPPTLSASAGEELVFPYFEAAFFGNIFLDEPCAYVSPGPRRPGRRVFLERAKRTPRRSRPSRDRSVRSSCVISAVPPRLLEMIDSVLAVHSYHAASTDYRWVRLLCLWSFEQHLGTH